MEIGIILAMLLTVAIFSYVYGETPLFRFAEHIFVGVATGHGMVVAYKYIVDNAVTPFINGNISTLIGLIFGVVMLFNVSKETAWISRWSIGIMTGAILGLGVKALVSVNLVNQIVGTISPFVGKGIGLETLNALLILIGTITSLMYFTFTYKNKGLEYLSRIGRIFLMITLGGYFGNTTLSRLTLLSGRIVFLLKSLGLVPS